MELRNCYSEESPPTYTEVIDSDQLPQYNDAIGNATHQSPSTYETLEIEEGPQQSSYVNGVTLKYSLSTCLPQFASVLGGEHLKLKLKRKE